MIIGVFRVLQEEMIVHDHAVENAVSHTHVCVMLSDEEGICDGVIG